MLIFSLITITASWNIISISALIFFNTCFSSYLPVSMSRRHVHNRAGVFHTLYIVQRDTIICPYFVKFSTLYQFPLSHIWGSFILIPPPFILPAHTFPSPPSPLPLPGQFPSVPTTSSQPMPHDSSPPPCIFPEVIALQYTACPYSSFDGFRFPSS